MSIFLAVWLHKKGVPIHLTCANLVDILGVPNEMHSVSFWCASARVTEDPMWVYEKALSRFGVHAQGVGKKLVKANGLGGNWKVAALLIGTSLAPRYSKQTANLQMIDVYIIDKIK